jgi:hypothetical protein
VLAGVLTPPQPPRRKFIVVLPYEAAMTTSEWISVIALMISSGGFALQPRSWLMSGPHLHLSVIADALTIPDDGQGSRLALIVINRRDEPTMLTHMVAFVYPSRWAKLRKKAAYAGIVNATNIPHKLDINATWIGQMMCSDLTEVVVARKDGTLYVGVITSHKDGMQLINVPPPKKERLLTNKIASA